IVFVACLALSGAAARAQQPRKKYKDLDLADFLDLGEHYVKPVDPRKDAKTGFLVGGKNDTAPIRGLKGVNRRTIADLEKDMRPGAKSEVGSNAASSGRRKNCSTCWPRITSTSLTSWG